MPSASRYVLGLKQYLGLARSVPTLGRRRSGRVRFQWQRALHRESGHCLGVDVHIDIDVLLRRNNSAGTRFWAHPLSIHEHAAAVAILAPKYPNLAAAFSVPYCSQTELTRPIGAREVADGWSVVDYGNRLHTQSF